MEHQLADAGGVRLAAQLLHHRADERAGRGDLAALHALIGDHLNDYAEPESVLVGIETDRSHRLRR